jgi:hypothetical protein
MKQTGRGIWKHFIAHCTDPMKISERAANHKTWPRKAPTYITLETARTMFTAARRPKDYQTRVVVNSACASPVFP